MERLDRIIVQEDHPRQRQGFAAICTNEATHGRLTNRSSELNLVRQLIVWVVNRASFEHSSDTNRFRFNLFCLFHPFWIWLPGSLERVRGTLYGCQPHEGNLSGRRTQGRWRRSSCNLVAHSSQRPATFQVEERSHQGSRVKLE